MIVHVRLMQTAGAMQSGPATTSQALPMIAVEMQMRGSSALASGPASGLARLVPPLHWKRSLSQSSPSLSSVICAHVFDAGSQANPGLGEAVDVVGDHLGPA